MVIYSGGGDKMKRVAEYKDWGDNFPYYEVNDYNYNYNYNYNYKIKSILMNVSESDLND